MVKTDNCGRTYRTRIFTIVYFIGADPNVVLKTDGRYAPQSGRSKTHLRPPEGAKCSSP